MAPPVSTSAVVSATMGKPELSRQTSVPPDFTTRFVNLADPRLGAKALFATDEFFAAKERMLNPEPAVFVPGKYDEHGKWMDGWETRRKRTLGYNYCVVQLARSGVIRGLDIDTSYFTGNFPPAASLDGCYCPEGEPTDKTPWTEVLPSTTLKGNSHHYLDVDTDKVFTHVRLNIYPDGGVARLRVFSVPQCDWECRQNNAEKVDLIAMENGGYVVASNDQHYGKASNLLLPGRGVNMGDGWETRRRREPGNDWCIIALAHPGEVEEIEVDTAFFKGNYPDRCSIQAANVTGGTFDSLVTQSMFWPVLLQEHKLQMDAQHFFKDVEKLGPITHIRFNIIPDGGVSRLRLFGRLTGAKKTHCG